MVIIKLLCIYFSVPIYSSDYLLWPNFFPLLMVITKLLFLYFSVPTNPSDDLLGLNFFGSSASTPTGGGYNLPSPMSPMSDGAITNSDTSAIHNTTQSSSSE